MATTGEAVGLLYDTGHCLFAGGDPRSAAGARISRASCTCTARMRERDVLEERCAEDMSFMDAVLDGIFTVPGDGCIDYPAAAARLADTAIAAGWWSRPSRTRARRTP